MRFSALRARPAHGRPSVAECAMVYGRWRFGSFRPVPLPRAPPARRGWAHARDYVEGMWLILQQEDSDDYVLATGETRSGREFVEKAFKSPGAAQGCTKSGPHPGRGRPALFPPHRGRPSGG